MTVANDIKMTAFRRPGDNGLAVLRHRNEHRRQQTKRQRFRRRHEREGNACAKARISRRRSRSAGDGLSRVKRERHQNISMIAAENTCAVEIQTAEIKGHRYDLAEGVRSKRSIILRQSASK